MSNPGAALPDRSQLTLDLVQAVAAPQTIGGFIDSALEMLASNLRASLVSFNRLDMTSHNAIVVTRPYREEHVVAVDHVSRLLAEHPLLSWACHHRGWPVVRLSDVATPQVLARSRLYREVLRPVGAAFSLFIFLTSTQSANWVYFVANRPDIDFDAKDVALAAALQPAFVALFHHLSRESVQPDASHLTPRELTALGYLANGLTAAAIARKMGAQQATVRKHLQNVYAKLVVADRLNAVMRARELGLLRDEDLSQEFAQQIRTEVRVVAQEAERAAPSSIGDE